MSAGHEKAGWNAPEGEFMTTVPHIVAGRLSRRAIALTAVVLVALCTTACFDNEPRQRQAFIKFLQTRIIDKPGLHIPIMSDKDIADFGPYADQYRIMNGFHHDLNNTVSGDLARAMQISTPRTLSELADKRAIIPVLKDGVIKMMAALDQDEARADAARMALHQPADLKRVYDAAYVRMVTRPARVFRELTPMINKSLPSIEALAAYLDEHRDAIQFQGNNLTVNNPEVREKLAALMEDAAKAGELADAGKRKLRAMAEDK
jgi:hypothetical protein